MKKSEVSEVSEADAVKEANEAEMAAEAKEKIDEFARAVMEAVEEERERKEQVPEGALTTESALKLIDSAKRAMAREFGIGGYDDEGAEHAVMTAILVTMAHHIITHKFEVEAVLDALQAIGSELQKTMRKAGMLECDCEACQAEREAQKPTVH